MNQQNYIIKEVIYYQEKEAINNIRRIVFQEEQGVAAELEFDGQDQEAIHLLAYYGDKPVGTTRIRQIDSQTYKIERLAVLKPFRGQKIGENLIRTALEIITRNNQTEKVIVNSQEYIKTLYQTLGFTQVGTSFIEAGIPHVKMIKQLT